MKRNEKLKVMLFALTGFGNTVLEALLGDPRVNLTSVFTVKYNNPFPYYEERQLIERCTEWQVPCYHGIKVCSDDGIMLARQYSPDLIIMATFKQILQKNILSLPPLGVVNIHPSLLPRYRGPCPTNAALLNGERVTGVTFHYVTEDLDKGDILLQRAIPINDEDNDGHLRRKLARLAGEMTPDLIGMFADFAKPMGMPQDHYLASYAPRPTVEDGHLALTDDFETIKRKIRALNPFPGTSILVNGNWVAVDRFELLESNTSGEFCANSDTIHLTIGHRTIRLFRKGELG